MMSTGSLRQLLAMPPTLRTAMLGRIAYCSARPTLHRPFSVSTKRYRACKYPDVAAFSLPEFRSSNITDVAPAELFKSSSLLSAPGKPLEDELTNLFTKNPASFAYAESDFYKLKKNTRLPEVCILGRSNVGKSSFVNALANRSSNGLAFVSTKAGKTRSINTYGFGPAPTIKELQGKAADHPGEELPTHTFLLVDMPGYGHASLKEWGKNISLYLSKRTFVKGAMVLIDAEVGPKDSDLHLIELLSQAQLKTAIVLTKADKVKGGLDGLRETCAKVWDAIYAIDARITEGKWAWDRDVFVTAVGARDPLVAKSTLTTARLAVARLAGLVKDERSPAERTQKWSGKVVSFDDLVIAPTKPTTAGTNVAPGGITGGSNSTVSFASLDRASKLQNSIQSGLGIGLGSGTLGQGSPLWARAFHSTAVHPKNGQYVPKRGRTNKPNLGDVLDDFVKTLKADTKRDDLRRLQTERARDMVYNLGSREQHEKRQRKQFQQIHPEKVARGKDVLNMRVMKEAEQLKEATATTSPAASPAKPKQDVDDWAWPSAPTSNAPKKGQSVAISPDAFTRAFFGHPDPEPEKQANQSNQSSGSSKKNRRKRDRRKGNKGKAKVNDWVREKVVEDPFVAKFTAKMAPQPNSRSAKKTAASF